MQICDILKNLLRDFSVIGGNTGSDIFVQWRLSVLISPVCVSVYLLFKFVWVFYVCWKLLLLLMSLLSWVNHFLFSCLAPKKKLNGTFVMSLFSLSTKELLNLFVQIFLLLVQNYVCTFGVLLIDDTCLVGVESMSSSVQAW